jgi:protochlorophyllide reductase
MSKWKLPTPVNVAQEAAIEEKFGDKKLVVITGTSSGLGRKTAGALLRTGQYHVVGAVRDLDKMEAVAELDEWPLDRFTPMECELNSFQSVRDFCDNLKEWKVGKPIDRLICNAGVYQPSLPYAKWSVDDHEQTMQINYLSHFLMISELLDDMTEAKDPRVIMVGSVTGNDNTVGGGGVYPIADLKNLDGFRAGFKNPIAMADGYGFIGAKAYKDSKLCLMMLSNMLHARYHKRTGIAFSSIYPGCLAESPLFREKRAWFRRYFPVFMKYITGGFVSEEEAGQRLFQVAHDPRCSKSGVYWSWNGGPRENRGLEALEKGGQISGGGGAGGGWDSIYENDQSDKVNDIDLSVELFKYSTEITGAKWPVKKTVVSPCPTLKVIGAISNQMIAKEELKRMAEKPGLNEDGTPIKPKLTVKKKAVLVTDKVVGGILSRTVGRVARFANRRLLGKLPEEALTGSFQEEKPLAEATSVVSISTPEGDIVAADQVELFADAPVANGSNGATAPAANGASLNGAAAPVANGVNGATSHAASRSNGVAAPHANGSQQVFSSTVDEADQESIQDEISVQVFNKDTIIEVQGEEKTVQASA